MILKQSGIFFLLLTVRAHVPNVAGGTTKRTVTKASLLRTADHHILTLKASIFVLVRFRELTFILYQILMFKLLKYIYKY